MALFHQEPESLNVDDNGGIAFTVTGETMRLVLATAILALIAYAIGYQVGIADRPLSQALLNAAARARSEARYG